MQIMMLGAAGMVGRKLTQHLASAGHSGGEDRTALSLVDTIEPERPAHFSKNVSLAVTDISVPGAAAKCVATRPAIIFHLAAVVSGHAEAALDTGDTVNFDGTRQIFEALRYEGTK